MHSLLGNKVADEEENERQKNKMRRGNNSSGNDRHYGLVVSAPGSY
jgi:hypothetical protein